MPNPTPSTAEAPRPTPTNVAPLTPAMQQQLETEGYVVLENFLTPDELEDLREFDLTHPIPKDIESNDSSVTVFTSDLPYRRKIGEKFKTIASTKLERIIGKYRIVSCPWFRKAPNSENSGLHQDPYFTDESIYRSLGLWCPLNNVDPEKACLCVVKGSHTINSHKRSYNIFIGWPYEPEQLSYLQKNYLTPISLKAGQAILFDKRLFHGSSLNISNSERVAATGFIIIPENAPLYFCYRESEQANNIEVFQVPDDFYNRYIYGEKPSGEGVTLIKTEPYTCDPLTPELIAEKLDPLHPDRAIPRLKTQLAETQTYLEQSRSQLQGELTAANEQLHKKNTELATLKEDYSQTQAELEHLREQLQQTQVDLEPTKQERDRLCDELQDLQAAYNELQTERDRQTLELEQHRTTQNQAHLAALIHKRHHANGH